MKKKFSIRVRPECRTLGGVSKDKKRRSLLLIFVLFLSSSCFAADHAREQRSFSQRALAIVRSEISSHKKPLIAASLALLLRVYNFCHNHMYKNLTFDLEEIIYLLLIAGATYKEARDLQSSPSKLYFINKERILSFTFALLTTYLTYKNNDYNVKAIHKFGTFIRGYLSAMFLQYIKRVCLANSLTDNNVSRTMLQEADSAKNYFSKFIFSSLIVFAISRPKNPDEIDNALLKSIALHTIINIMHMGKLFLVDGNPGEFREIQNKILNFFDRGGIRHESLPAVGRIDHMDNARNETTTDENPL